MSCIKTWVGICKSKDGQRAQGEAPTPGTNPELSPSSSKSRKLLLPYQEKANPFASPPLEWWGRFSCTLRASLSSQAAQLQFSVLWVSDPGVSEVSDESLLKQDNPIISVFLLGAPRTRLRSHRGREWRSWYLCKFLLGSQGCRGSKELPLSSSSCRGCFFAGDVWGYLTPSWCGNHTIISSPDL